MRFISGLLERLLHLVEAVLDAHLLPEGGEELLHDGPGGLD
jgi:hypothetical protein